MVKQPHKRTAPAEPLHQPWPQTSQEVLPPSPSQPITLTRAYPLVLLKAMV